MSASEATAVPWWREPTRNQWISFSAAWVGWILDAFDFTIFLLAMPKIAEAFGVSNTATAWSITLTLIFRLIGGYMAGLASDRWGHKWPLLLSIVWFALCDGAVAFAPSFTVVLILRTLFGLGMGAEWTAGATLAMESWPQRSRGIASGILQGSWAIGYLLAGVVYGLVEPKYGWRALFLVAALPALLALPMRALVPDNAEHKAKVAKVRPSAKDLLAPGLVRQIAWASAVMALGFGGYYGLTSNYALLVKSTEAAKGSLSSLTIIFNLGMMVGCVVWGWMAMKRGPVPAVVVPAVLAVAVTPLYVGMQPGMTALMAGAALAGAFGGGYAGVTPLLLTSMFPIPVRARCVGIVYHVGAMFAAFVPPAISSLNEKGGLPIAQAILLVAGGSNLALAVALLLRPRNILDMLPGPAVVEEPRAAVAVTAK
ncbi:MAG TPA: MFS transporter [Myxococcaceae bacterium]|nr:MFS transporter [Myxococcaceae bacterium]